MYCFAAEKTEIGLQRLQGSAHPSSPPAPDAPGLVPEASFSRLLPCGCCRLFLLS